jgi:hypothetical protein
MLQVKFPLESVFFYTIDVRQVYKCQLSLGLQHRSTKKSLSLEAPRTLVASMESPSTLHASTILTPRLQPSLRQPNEDCVLKQYNSPRIMLT